MDNTTFEKSAIIGYWRSGAQLNEITIVMLIPINAVFEVILEYIKHQKIP